LTELDYLMHPYNSQGYQQPNYPNYTPPPSQYATPTYPPQGNAYQSGSQPVAYSSYPAQPQQPYANPPYGNYATQPAFRPPGVPPPFAQQPTFSTQPVQPQRVPINLAKAGSIVLDKALEKVYVGLSWDGIPGSRVDLDLSIACINRYEKLPSDAWFVFYNNLESPGSVIKHSGDNRQGGAIPGQQDDESVTIDLSRVPPEIIRILVIASINEGGNSFAAIHNATLRLIDMGTNMVTHQVNLAKFHQTRCIVFAEIFRHGPATWAINAVCGDVGRLEDLVRKIEVS
jgi:tellurium resistance protein TerD